MWLLQNRHDDTVDKWPKFCFQENPENPLELLRMQPPRHARWEPLFMVLKAPTHWRKKMDKTRHGNVAAVIAHHISKGGNWSASHDEKFIILKAKEHNV